MSLFCNFAIHTATALEHLTCLFHWWQCNLENFNF